MPANRSPGVAHLGRIEVDAALKARAIPIAMLQVMRGWDRNWNIRVAMKLWNGGNVLTLYFPPLLQPDIADSTAPGVVANQLAGSFKLLIARTADGDVLFSLILKRPDETCRYHQSQSRPLCTLTDWFAYQE